MTTAISAASRVPPHNLEAEQSVLGACLLADVIHEVSAELTPDDFYRANHAAIFRAMLAMTADGEPVDLVALRARMKTTKEQDGYLLTLTNVVPTAANATRYARIVRECAANRALITAGTRIATLGYESDDAASAIGAAHTLLADATQDRSAHKARRVGELIDERMAHITERREYVELPGFLGVHVCPGDMLVVGGSRATGKTAFALHLLAETWAAEMPVRFYSYEMTDMKLTDRIMSKHSGVAVRSLEEGVPDNAVPALSESLDAARMLELDIQEAAGLTQAELFSSLRRFAADGGRVAVIDYMQIAADTSRHGQTYDVTHFSRGLKRTLLDTHLIGVAVSQTSRAGHVRDGKFKLAQLSDLRDSGSIENDADEVILLTAYTNPFETDSREYVEKLVRRESLDFDVEAWQTGRGESPRLVMVDVAKMRQDLLRRWPFVVRGGWDWRPCPIVAVAAPDWAERGLG